MISSYPPGGNTMFGLFKYDGFLVQTCNKIVDCICLSLLWLVTSLPIVTIGAADAAPLRLKLNIPT